MTKDFNSDYEKVNIFDPEADNFENQFEVWLKDISELIRKEEAGELMKKEGGKDTSGIKKYCNRYYDRLNNNEKNYSLNENISLEDFLYQVFVVLRDEFNSLITQTDNGFIFAINESSIFKAEFAKCENCLGNGQIRI